MIHVKTRRVSELVGHAIQITKSVRACQYKMRPRFGPRGNGEALPSGYQKGVENLANALISRRRAAILWGGWLGISPSTPTLKRASISAFPLIRRG